MSQENSQWILHNNGEYYTLSYRSILAPDTYVEVAKFNHTVPYLIIDTVRYVLNKYYEEADREDGELFADREAQWAPYIDSVQKLNDELNKTKTPTGEVGQYL